MCFNPRPSESQSSCCIYSFYCTLHSTGTLIHFRINQPLSLWVRSLFILYYRMFTLRRKASFLHPTSRRGVLTRLFSAKQHNNSRSRHNDEKCQIQNEERKAGWKKKKVSLVFGYVGKNYSGLQMIDPSVSTIEREVEGALFALGCILPTNRQSLEKIGWSRSSRTDKGEVLSRVCVMWVYVQFCVCVSVCLQACVRYAT